MAKRRKKSPTKAAQQDKGPTVPFATYAAWAGRPSGTVRRTARTWKLRALLGDNISLPKAIRALHDFIAKHANRLAKRKPSETNGEPTSPWLERMRREKFLVARMERLKMAGEMLDRAKVHEGLGVLGRMLADMGRRWRAEGMHRAADQLNETIDDFQRYVDDTFGSDQADDLDGGQ
jgi:hypothetical protein